MHPSLPKLVVLLLLFLTHRVSADLDLHDSLSSPYDSLASVVSYEDLGSDIEQRRWLYWRRIHYYISYAAMAANHIPCRPRSGRSYYNHQCSRLSGPVHPYFRGCEAITRCRR